MNSIQTVLKEVQESSSFDEGLSCYGALRSLVVERDAAYRQERSTITKIFKPHMDRIMGEYENCRRAAHMMLQILSNIAAKSWTVQAFGQDTSQDVTALYSDIDGLKALNKFQVIVENPDCSGEWRDQPGAFMDRAAEAAQILEEHPEKLGSLHKPLPECAPAVK